MQGYLSKVRQAQSNFEVLSIRQIPRGQNSHTDSLAMLATSSRLGLPWVIIIKDMMDSGHNDQIPICSIPRQRETPTTLTL